MSLPPSRAAGDLVAWAAAELRAVTSAARLEAEILLAESAGLSRAAIMAHPERNLGRSEAARLAAAVARRSRGEPIAYITGRKEFWSLSLAVDARVLVPRPETELIVEAALARLPAAGARVLDLGTGSGAIALALKRERPAAAITAVDLSPEALAVARANGARLGLDVDWIESDWFEALGDARFELIVSNPPYVASGDLALSGLGAEPGLALDGGGDGLDACRRILGAAERHLAAGGWLLLEHGHDQREALAALARAAGFVVEAALDDLAGLPRVLALVPRSVAR